MFLKRGACSQIVFHKSEKHAVEMVLEERTLEVAQVTK